MRPAILCIRGYQRMLSPILPPLCRFHPSCSQYAIDALTARGLIKGSLLALWRILRCNPLVPGGYDPVEPVPEDPSRSPPENR